MFGWMPVGMPCKMPRNEPLPSYIPQEIDKKKKQEEQRTGRWVQNEAVKIMLSTTCLQSKNSLVVIEVKQCLGQIGSRLNSSETTRRRKTQKAEALGQLFITCSNFFSGGTLLLSAFLPPPLLNSGRCSPCSSTKGERTLWRGT